MGWNHPEGNALAQYMQPVYYPLQYITPTFLCNLGSSLDRSAMPEWNARREGPIASMLMSRSAYGAVVGRDSIPCVSENKGSGRVWP